MSLKRVFANRISNPVKALRVDFKHGQLRLGIDRFMSSLTAGTAVGRFFGKRVSRLIYRQLDRFFAPTIEKYKNYEYECQYDKNSPVWVLWMQGYDNAPTIVKKCIDSIRNATAHPVHLITEENLDSYYDFPDFIKDKLASGIITKAQFSDILRFTLLSEYGGIWIDATIFIPKAIPEEVFKREFFTCKRPKRESGYVSEYRWTSFLNGCQKNCVIQKAAKELFFEYWKKFDYLVDYLLVDYSLLIVYNNVLRARELIDELPYNNIRIEELQELMSEEYDAEKYNELINSTDTSFFKLSWRMDFPKEKNGRKTFYGKFTE